MASAVASRRVDAEVVTADFFAWAAGTDRRFAAAVGNPPFIRYQRFSGRARRRALEYCAGQGVRLSGLCSSWAPFVVGASRLLKPGGRLAFVVPAEIGHAVYAKEVVRYLLGAFARVEVIAVREKLFPDLSEDCWLLRASGFGGRSEAIHFARLDSLNAEERAWSFETASAGELEQWDFRLRVLLVSRAIRSAYQDLAVPHDGSPSRQRGAGRDRLRDGRERFLPPATERRRRARHPAGAASRVGSFQPRPGG